MTASRFCLILAMWVSLFTPTAGAAPAGCRRCRQLLERVLQDPALARFGKWRLQATPRDAPGKSAFSIAGNRHDARAVVILDHTRHILLKLELRKREPRWAVGCETADASTLLAQAEAFARRWQPMMASPECRIEQRVPLPYESFAEQAVFQLQAVDKRTGFSRGTAVIGVSIASGAVISWEYAPARWPAPESIGVTRDAAERKLIPLAANLLGGASADVCLVEHTGSFTAEERPLPYYSFIWSLRTAKPDQAGNVPVAMMQVDATGGAILYTKRTVLPGWMVNILTTDPLELIRRWLAQKGTVRDSWPVWDAAGRCLFMRTNRVHTGGPWWKRTEAITRCTLDHTALAYLEPGWQPNDRWNTIRSLTFLSTSASLFYTGDFPGCCQIKRNTGAYAAFGNSEPGLYTDDISASGAYLAYIAGETPEDTDVFVARAPVTARQPLRGKRVTKLEGEDRLPVLSADAQRVYFVHYPPAPDAAGTVSLYCVGINDSGRRNPSPWCIAAGFSGVERLSLFPDGKRLLVTTNNGLEIVDVESGVRTPLPLQNLQDPDSHQPVIVHEAAVSPDGVWIAFSGEVVRQTPERQSSYPQYLYLIRIDGSGLKRITPLVEMPLAPYVFPASGKSAFDLAKARYEAHGKLSGLKKP